MSPPAQTFKNKYLSVSRIRLYEQCSLAFRFRYVDKAEGLPFGDAPAFGVILHAALEAFFRWVIDEEYVGPLPVERLVAEYKKAWAVEQDRYGNERLRGTVGIGMYQEGLQILRTYAASHPPIDHFSILAVEQEFNIQVGDFLVNGFIDRIDKVDDETIRIVDYKSNRKMYTRNELATDLQMGAYGVAARTLYPWAKRVSFVFQMLRFDTRQESLQSVQTIDDVAGYIDAIGKRIERDTEWKPRLNEDCGYCDYRNQCPAYAAAIEGKTVPTVRPFDTIDEVVRERQVVATLAKMLYARKEEYDRILKKKIAEEGEYDAGGCHVRFIPAYDTSYPRVSTVEAFVRLRRSRDDVRSDAEVRAEIERRLLVVDAKAVAILRDEVAETAASPSQVNVLKVSIDALAVRTPSTPRIDVRAHKVSKSVASLEKTDKTRAKP